MYKILVVEDDSVISSAIARHLQAWGYEAKSVQSFRHVLEEFQAYAPQLVLMDITLPYFNGYHWCSEIRKISHVPVIFISSATEKMNILMAINMGGDDFITKPFDLEVLTAKVQAVLRRSYDFTGEKTEVLESGGAQLSTADATLSFRGQKLDLTKNEYKILQTLMENKGRIVSRETLMKRLWETDVFVDENTLTVNITRLRRKLETAGLVDFIKTKKGIGYLIE